MSHSSLYDPQFLMSSNGTFHVAACNQLPPPPYLVQLTGWSQRVISSQPEPINRFWYHLKEKNFTSYIVFLGATNTEISADSHKWEL
ncbi:hypothetical protein GDO81_020995 [Engystomops pustulosus]|uniref:Uncharacterized protein n=1 Tax=Engystomops pustulosus TaxID=76066 RepID=A0AAV6Z7D9_ENGPU|nr:hypothetical protein GDO81_020995 [Engystomops pustulosus]